MEGGKAGSLPELLVSAQRREPYAWDRIAAIVWRIFRGLQLNVPQHVDPCDVEQDVLTRIVTVIAYVASIERPGAYIAKVIRTVLIDHIRRSNAAKRDKRRERSISASAASHADDGDPLYSQFRAPGMDPAETAEIEERNDRLRAVLSELPESRDKETLQLKYLDGLSYQEIAAVQGCSPKAVSSAIARARRNIRPRLEREDIRP